MDRKKGIVTFTRVELMQVALKTLKSKRGKNERSCSQVKKRSSNYFAVAVKSSGDISVEPVRGQKIKEHVVTDLDLRNDQNRPSLAVQQQNVKKYHRKAR